ncbi:MAG: hypothetical protein RIT28_4995, partial [Pseudomonadota bacterium]
MSSCPTTITFAPKNSSLRFIAPIMT